MELEQIKNTDHETLWKTARWGVICFCVIHLLFEVLSGNTKIAGFPVVFNFFVSAWYIKKQIKKNKEMGNLFVMGLAVSGVVFLIRFVLGTIFYLIITQSNDGKAELIKKEKASNLVFESQSTPHTLNLLVPKFHKLVRIDSNIDSSLFITTLNHFNVLGFEDKNSLFKEFLYDYEFKSEELNINADSTMKDISNVFAKAVGLKKISSKFFKNKWRNAFEGFYESQNEKIRFLFITEQRGRYSGILCTVAPPQYYNMQDSIIKHVLFLYRYDMK